VSDVLAGYQVDSFRWLTKSSGQCQFKGCTRKATVGVFYDSQRGQQQRAVICMRHALDLANHSIGHWKFQKNDR